MYLLCRSTQVTYHSLITSPLFESPIQRLDIARRLQFQTLTIDRAGETRFIS